MTSWALMRSRPTQGAVGVIALVLLVVGVSAARGPEVPTYVVSRAKVVQRVVASGRVMAPATIPLSSIALAQVSRVLVEAGARVDRRQVLIEMDDSDARASLEQARAGVSQAQARLGQVRKVESHVAGEALRQSKIRLEQAESKLRRTEALAQGGASSQADLEDARYRLEQARSENESALAQALGTSRRGVERRLAAAGLAQARAVAAAAETKFAQMRICAPVAGVILERHVEPGEVVQPGKTLLLLALEGDARLTMQVDEKNRSLLELSQRATAVADAFPREPFSAEVSFIAPSIDPARGTVEVRLKVPRPPSFLMTDMTVSVNVDVSRRAGALTLPAEAVHDAAGEPWVMVVEEGRTRRQAVEVGARGEGVVEVLQGIAEGDVVVLAPAPTVPEGKRVRAVAAPTHGASDAL